MKSIRYNTPLGLMDYEIIGIQDDGTEVFLGALYRGINFEAISLTIDGKEFSLDLHGAKQ